MRVILMMGVLVLLSGCDTSRTVIIKIDKPDTKETTDQEDEELLPVPLDMMELKRYLRVDRTDLRPGDIYLPNKNFNFLIRHMRNMTQEEIRDYLRDTLQFKER